MKKYKIVSGANFADRKKLTKSLNSIITKSWGNFGSKYVENHITRADYLVISLYQDKIIGFASANKYLIKNEEIYYLEFTAILPEHQGFSLSKKMNEKIFRMIILNSLRRLKLSFIIITISPNPRVLGTLARTSSYIYPDPYSVPAKVSNKYYELTRLVIKKIKEPYRKLEREGNVIEGFYDNAQYLIHDPEKVQKDKDQRVNDFSQHYLKYHEKKGRDFVICAKYRLIDFLRN